MLPAEVVLGAGLDVGVELDRPRALRVRRALRRYEATATAAQSLRRRDLSEHELDARLTASRVAPATRAETVTRLTRVGAVDDERLARNRAEVLAARGAGDHLIRHDLLRRGIADEVVDAAVTELESEVARAGRIAAVRGPSPKTARYLTRKGFSEDSIESAFQQAVAEDAPPAVR